MLNTTYATAKVPVDGCRREVADGDADVLAARLFAQPGSHCLRQLDSVHWDAPLRERECDPASPDPELERTLRSRLAPTRKPTAGSTTAGSKSSAAASSVSRGDTLVEVPILLHSANCTAT